MMQLGALGFLWPEETTVNRLTRERYVSIAWTLAGCLVVAYFIGCSNTNSSSSTPPSACYANARCPISGMSVDTGNVPPDRVRLFEGHKIAFSSPDCASRWDKLNDQEKLQRLNQVLAPAPTAVPRRVPAQIGGG